MAHYYYFPFYETPPDEGAKTTQLTMLLKYELGKAPNTRESKRTDPDKNYTRQAGVTTVCNYHKRADGSFGYRDTSAGQPLVKVRENDVLLINGHGAPTGNFISSNEKNGVTLTPEELTTILIMEGLNDGVVIKILTCYGGGQWDSDQKDNGIFAKRLAKLIGSKKKENVIVGGYPGIVMAAFFRAEGEKNLENMTPVQLTVVNEKQDQRLTGKEAIRYYDKHGNLTQRPAASKSPR